MRDGEAPSREQTEPRLKVPALRAGVGMRPARPLRCSPFRAVLGGLLLVAGLQLLYLSLLPGLQGRGRRRGGGGGGGGSPSHGLPDPEPERRRRELSRALEGGGQPDPSGRYRLYPDVSRAPVLSRRPRPGHVLGLATHCSANNLHHLPGLVSRWRAPLSLALFATAADLPEALRALHLLGLHCPGVRELVAFTLVTPARVPAAFPPGEAEQEEGQAWDPDLELDLEPELPPPCRRALRPVLRLRRRFANYGLPNASYPGNLLRNAARRALPSRYVAVIDVDMLPSGGLHRRLLELLSAAGPEPRPGPGPTVYVLPALEMRRSRRVPADKAELQRLYQVGEVRPFYGELCPRCHAPTNYSRWINLAAGPGLGVAYTLAWSDPWEPFYLGPRSVPPYDERFEQYGFNRISQACELHVAGYSFAVLDNAFLIHKGFKVAGEFHPQKDNENRHNRVLFRQFKQELKQKYPESPRRC